MVLSELPNDWHGPVLLSEIGSSHNDALSPETPLWFRTTNTEEGKRHQVFFQQEVTGAQLFSVLSATCNSHASRGGVLMDWKQIYKPENSGDRYLQKIHTVLGQPWFNFLNVLLLFYHTLRDGESERDQQIIRLFSEEGTSFARLFQEMNITRNEMREILREDPHIAQRGKMGEIKKRTMEIIERRDSPAWQRLLRDRFERIEGGLLLPREHSDLKDHIPQKAGETQSKEIIEPSTNAQKNIIISRVNRLAIRLVEEITYPERTMAGLLEWKTNANGMRTIFTGQVPPEDQSAIAPMVFLNQLINRSQNSINTTLGLLALATMDRDITRKWPREMPLPGRGKMQIVGEAQIPVFALMQAKKFAQGEVIARLEKKADELATNKKIN